MRIAVLADIHGNVLALEAVIADLRSVAPDLVVNLGDHLSGPLWAAETADLLMSQGGWAQIRGNHDRQLLEVAPDAMGASDRAAHSEIADSHRRWLASLACTMSPAEGVLLCHGTPESDLEYLLEDVSGGFARLADLDVMRVRLGGVRGLVLCGHSHVPRWVQVDGETLAANPGSVGLPAYDDLGHAFPHVMETGSPHARVLVVDRRGAAWEAAFRLVTYDWEAAARKAEDGSRPEWAHALRTGRAAV
jgi:predicted phosphodiesterase